MFNLLTSLIIGLFVAMLFLNVYFRVKVMKSYKKLVQKRVEFGFKDLLNKEKIEREVIPKYPHAEKDIREFTNHIRYSVKMGTVLIVLITAFGAVLMWYRNS
ncbi:MAG: hypothetical protein R2788_10670 [Saprospiraceae bacterium]|jgi:hypothetical protein